MTKKRKLYLRNYYKTHRADLKSRANQREHKYYRAYVELQTLKRKGLIKHE